MRSLWAVARHTFAECLRMRIAVAFIVLLALTLLVLPLSVKGDGTLAGRIRTVLSYGVGATGMLLSLITVFAAAGIVTSDVRKRQIFLVVTKPIARWQYVLGRWLGVLLLDVLLLAIAGTAIYASAQYLRRGEALNPNDRRAVETEIFAARRRVEPVPLDLSQRVRDRVERMRQEGTYDAALREHMDETGDTEAAWDALVEQIAREEATKAQAAGPDETLQWRFEGIDVAGDTREAAGTVTAMSGNHRIMRIETTGEITSRLVTLGPVEVDGILGVARRIGEGFFEAQFRAEDAAEPVIAGVELGDEVRVTVEPTIQITFKARTSAAQIPGETLRSLWTVENPRTGAVYRELREDPPAQAATLTVTAHVVDPQGATILTYRNLPKPEVNWAASVSVPREDISVLYRTGGFAGNYLRAMALILIQLAFLAAATVLAASFLSFPVAVLTVGVVLVFGWMAGFLLEATRLSTVAQPGLGDYVSYYFVRGVGKVLPNLSTTSPGDALVDAMQITWPYLGSVLLLMLALRTGLSLLAACVIFRKRELARVQV